MNIPKNYTIKTVLAYAPLKALISRDDDRNLLLKRPERRKQYARAYIYETFHQLYGNDSTYSFVDEINPADIQRDLINYPLHEATHDFFQKIAQSAFPVPIYTKRKYDLIIHTGVSDVDYAAREIMALWIGL